MSVSASSAVSMRTGTGRVRWMRRHTSRPVDPGEQEIEDHEVGEQSLAQRDPGRPVVGDLDREPLGPQPRRHGVGDRLLVLDDADQRSAHGDECASASGGRVRVLCRYGAAPCGCA